MTTSTDEDPVAAFMATAGAMVLESVNGSMEDAIVFVASSLTPHGDVRAATVTAIDRNGVDLRIEDAHAVHHERVLFGDPLAGPDDLHLGLQDLLIQARRAAPAAPLTEAERNAAELTTVRTFLTAVESVRDVHPHLRSITFAGGDLEDFWLPGPDAFVFLLAAPEGCDHLAANRDFTWEQHASMPDEVRPVGAYYTVRRWDRAEARVEVLVYLHGVDGPASAWAKRARVGEAVALWGPRTAFHPPPDTTHHLLLADETGLPAVAAILEWLPDEATAHVIAEVADASEEQELLSRPGIDVTWLHRDPGSPPFVDVVRTLPELTPGTYVWGGGESRALTDVRRHVRHERGLPRESVSLVAYWRA
jgi:NADPH-dependent ferric siderophore reductase